MQTKREINRSLGSSYHLIDFGYSYMMSRDVILIQALNIKGWQL